MGDTGAHASVRADAEAVCAVYSEAGNLIHGGFPYTAEGLRAEADKLDGTTNVYYDHPRPEGASSAAGAVSVPDGPREASVMEPTDAPDGATLAESEAMVAGEIPAQDGRVAVKAGSPPPSDSGETASDSASADLWQVIQRQRAANEKLQRKYNTVKGQLRALQAAQAASSADCAPVAASVLEQAPPEAPEEAPGAPAGEVERAELEAGTRLFIALSWVPWPYFVQAREDLDALLAAVVRLQRERDNAKHYCNTHHEWFSLSTRSGRSCCWSCETVERERDDAHAALRRIAELHAVEVAHRYKSITWWRERYGAEWVPASTKARIELDEAIRAASVPGDGGQERAAGASDMNPSDAGGERA